MLRGSDLTDRGILALEALEKLKAISIDQSKIGDPSLEVIGKFNNLEFLFLGGHRFSDEGVKHLAGLTDLTYLVLDGSLQEDLPWVAKMLGGKNQPATLVTEDGLRALKDLKKLKWMSIHNTEYSDAFVKEFNAAYPKCKLVELSLIHI